MDTTDADQPEPSSVASGFAAMQQQFQNMMLMMQADKLENTERFEAMNAAFQSETALLHGEIVATAKTHLGRQTGRKASLDGTPIRGMGMSRRTSAFQKAIGDGKRAPKALINGDVFKTMNFAGKSHESIQEHFIKFEYHARNQDKDFWCDLLQLTFNKTIGDSIIAQGLLLKQDRNDAQDCPAGWYNYEELCAWLVKKYHRAQFEMELLARIFYNYE